MLIFLTTLLGTLSSMFRSRAVLELEDLALRHQIGVLQRSARKTLQVDPSGPPVLGLAVPSLARLAFGSGDRQARNGGGLASLPAFAGSGPGRCGAANPDGPRFPARSET